MGLDEAEETKIIERAVGGDADAFTALFERYYAMIHAFAYRLCFDKEDAQEVAQDTFVKASRALCDFRLGGSFKHWLYRIAVNTSHDRNRSQTRRQRLAEALTEAAPPLDSSPANFSNLHKALASLTEELRQTVTLVYMEEMSHAEAAQVLGCAETTVSWRIFRAKRKLKALLGGADEG